MKKLLQISTSVNTRSTGRIAEEIGKCAISEGWESYIAFGRYKQESKSNLIKIGSKYGSKLHGLKSRLLDRHGFGSEQATKEFVKQIEKIQPDVIHFHNLHGYYLNVEVLFNFLNKKNIPIVWTLHDCWPFTGHCTYFSYIGCDRWQTQCYQCPQKNEYPASMLIDNSRENYITKKNLFTSISNLTLVPVSNWLGDLVKQSFLSKYPVTVINNGIDIESFSPKETRAVIRKFNLYNKTVIIGVASTWSERKGLNDFLRLNDKLDANEQLILVGLNKNQIHQLPQNIIGFERTENIVELAELYTVADVFVNPTWEDNFPTTNLESLACGTPVITYQTGGSIEAVTPATGFIVEQGNIQGLLDSIRTVKKKGKEYYRIACINRARALYNKEDRYLEYINLYEELTK